MIFNVDIDGVIYDWTESMRRELRAAGYDVPNVDPDRWAIWEAWGIDREIFWHHFHNGIREGRVFSYFEGCLIPGAVRVLARLRQRGHRIRLVTSKNLQGADSIMHARINTAEFLTFTGVPHDELVFAGGTKLGYEADVVIDDKPDARGWAQPGAWNMLFNQRWNPVEEVRTSVPLDRVYSWGDIENSIELYGIDGPRLGEYRRESSPLQEAYA